ncbi:MAG: type III pantothenate kinase [Bacteroidota bacterium]
MNLIVDIGNTRVKAALFNSYGPVETKVYSHADAILDDTTFIKQAKRAMIGSVVSEQDAFHHALNTLLPTTVFNSETKIPLTNLYQSASTLGSDRLAASVGAYNLYPNAPVLVIDAGTCIKYNFTNAQNEYLGGAISPGIQMKLKALNHFTSKLPLIEADFLYTALIGSNTHNSLLSGVLNGTIAEIDGIIDQYKLQFSDTICVLTGGDSEYLAKRLKNSIFAHQNLVLKGLNDILNYTLENT